MQEKVLQIYCVAKCGQKMQYKEHIKLEIQIILCSSLANYTASYLCIYAKILTDQIEFIYVNGCRHIEAFQSN